jgi:hypothetical protein
LQIACHNFSDAGVFVHWETMTLRQRDGVGAA